MNGPLEGAQISQADFEAMIRRWLLKVGARYIPVAAIGLAVALILIFVPTKQPSSTNTASGLGAGLGANSAPAAGGQSPGSALSSTGAGAAGGGAAATGSSSRGVPGASTQIAPVSPSTGGPAPATFFAAGGSTGGIAKTGVHCGNGARQVSWTTKAPLCVAAFTGNNGGATAHGVTPTTITLSYRLANSAQQQAIDTLAGAANVNQTDYIDDLNSYINMFNKQFELYGRHVVLKTYQGQGDYIEEDQGQDLGATESDAETASGTLHSFGDVTFSLEASQYYEQDLAVNHVIGFSSVGLSSQWFQQYAPYEYSVQGGTGTNGVTAAANLICRRMAGLPAVYSGDTLAQHSTRKFGIIFPQTPVYTAEVGLWKQLMQKDCGQSVAKTFGYTINIPEYESQSTNAMVQMQHAGVTTILCACDPIIPIFLTSSASGQNYHPEWFSPSYGDPVARNYTQSEWAHAIVSGIHFPPLATTEAYKAYQVGYPGKHPTEWDPSSPPYFYVPYYTLLQVFDALQAAGPDLTPYTFERAMFSLPASVKGGDIVGGYWGFGNQVYDPVSSYNLAWWNQTAKSNFDGTAGAYQWCNGGQTYYLTDPQAVGGPKQQLACF